MFSPSFNGTMIIISISVFKRGAKLEIEKLFSKHFPYLFMDRPYFVYVDYRYKIKQFGGGNEIREKKNKGSRDPLDIPHAPLQRGVG